MSINACKRIYSLFSYIFQLVILMSVFASVSQSGLTQNEYPLPTLDCGVSYSGCEVRVSLEGGLYIKENINYGLKLYAIEKNALTYANYDLSAYTQSLTGSMTEFVPFTNLQSVVFFGTADNGKISRLRLSNGEFSVLRLTNASERIVSCNQYSGRVGNYNHISRLGSGNHLMYCAITDQNEFLTKIIDVETGIELNSYNFNVPWNGIGQSPSWNMLLGGQDGNIYMDISASETRITLSGISEFSQNFPPQSWRLLRFDTQSETWTTRDILPGEMSSQNYIEWNNVISSRVVAIMQNGDVLHQFDSLYSSGSTVLSEISRYNSEFSLVERTTTSSSGAVRFAGVTSTGTFVVQNGSDLTNLQINHLIVLPPTLTPSPTHTSTPTPTPTPTVTPSPTPSAPFTVGIYRAMQMPGARVYIERAMSAGLDPFDSPPTDGWTLMGRTNGAGDNGTLRSFTVVNDIPYAAVQHYNKGCIVITPNTLEPRRQGQTRFVRIVVQQATVRCNGDWSGFTG